MQHPTAATARHGANRIVPDTTRRAGWGQRLLALATYVSTVAVGLVSVPTTSVPAYAAANETPRQMTIHVTDRGINQMPQWESGREQGLTWAMSNLDPAARIAVVMPRGADFDRMSTEELRRQIFNNLKARIDEARRSGHTEVEIQLVQDVNLAGYTGPRQEAAERFGTAAYSAIRDIGAYLKRQDVKVTNRANLGSNGSVVFAANVDAWSTGGKAIWDSVDIFDGRAFLTPMVKVIDRIGPARVRIFNTQWDLPAPYTPWAFRSIGNAATVQQLKDEYFPNLKVYKLTSLSAERGHVSGMSDANRFLVDEYMGRKEGYKPVPGSLSGSDLRRERVLPAAVERSIPPDVADGVAVWRSTAQGYLEALRAFADDFADEHGAKHSKTPTVRVLARAATLIQTLNEDIANAGEGRLVMLKSRTVEELVKFALEATAESPRATRSWFKPIANDIDAVTEMYSGLMEAARTGKVDIDTMQSFDQATVELARRRMTEKQVAAIARQFKLAEQQATVDRLTKQIGQVGFSARLGSGSRDIDAARTRELRLLNDRLATAKAELAGARNAAKAAEQRFAAKALRLDALPELAAAMAEHARQGRMTLDVADRYSDAVITLAATYLTEQAAIVFPVLRPYTAATRDALVTASRHVRDDVARKPIQDAHVFFTGKKWQALEQYHVYLNQAVRGPEAVKTFTEFHGGDVLAALGYSARETAEQDAFASRLNQHRAQRLEVQEPTAKREIAANEPEKPRHPEMAKLKPRREDPAPLPPGGGRRNSPSASGDGPDGRGPGGAATSRPPPCGPGAGTCGGIDLGLTALVVDPATRKIVALAEGGKPLTEAVDPDLMALALWLEYTGQRAAFSLDPYDPKDPKGPWLRAVYFPEALRGTVAGNQCFDADFLLKQMSFGVRLEGDRVVEHRSESGLVSVPELMSKRTGPSPEQWSRMWIVSREVRLTASDGIVRIEQAKMGVEARRQVPDPSTRSGLRDVATPADATEERFARQFEQLYDRLAATEAPSLAAVREVTKAIALARWLKQSGVRIDMQAVVAHLNRVRAPAVDKVSAVSVGWSSQTKTPFSDGRGSGVTTTTRKLHVFGGVDLTVAPKLEKSRHDDSLREAVVSRMGQPNEPSNFELTYAGRVYRAYVMPFHIADAHGR